MKKNYKIIISIFSFLFVFYFLIFRNIFTLMEVRENIEQKEIEIEKFNLNALELKKKSLEEEEEKLENLISKDEKENFSNIASLFNYLRKKIYTHNIYFENFARNQMKDENLKVTMSFRGDEVSIKNFFEDVENDIYDINFSNSYFIINSDKNILNVKASLKTKLKNEKENNDITINNKNIFNVSPNKNSETSVIRIGSKKFYRNKRQGE